MFSYSLISNLFKLVGLVYFLADIFKFWSAQILTTINSLTLQMKSYSISGFASPKGLVFISIAQLSVLKIDSK